MSATEPPDPAPTGPVRINPYTVPDDQHGWRGLSVPGHHKRKWYTVLHNEQVLVTALLLLPGEAWIRHSHESGELSIRYTGELRPVVTWNAPGALHGGPEPQPNLGDLFQDLLGGGAAPDFGDDPRLAALAAQIAQMQRQIQALQEQLLARLRPEPAPIMLVDVLFPPFKTTIDDPSYPEKKTVVGQWFD